MNESRACRECGEKGNRPDARFCAACGKPLPPPPARCPACGQESPVPGAKFCGACGSTIAAAPVPAPALPVAASPPSTGGDAPPTPVAGPGIQVQAPPPPPPPPPGPDPVPAPPAPPAAGKRAGPRVAAALLLLAAAVAFPAYWLFVRVPPPRLIVWTDAAERGEISVVPGTADPKGGYRVEPGPCAVTLSRDGKAVETARFTVIPGALHLVVPGGSGVEVSGKNIRMSEHFPVPGPLYSCSSCARLGTTPACGTCAKPARPAAPAADLDIRRHEPLMHGTQPEPVLLVCNPYGAALAGSVRQGPVAIEFLLPAGAVRPVPCVPGSAATVRTNQESDGTLLEECEIRTPEGASLFTVGGATWYEWLAEDGSRTPEGTIPPQHLAPLTCADGGRLLRGEDGMPGLLRQDGPGQPARRLLPIVSVPLLPPAPEALGKLTLHPALEVAEVSLPTPLRGRVVEAVAAGRAGTVVVVDGALHDLASGERLHDAGPPIGSAAFSPDGLFLITRQAACATLDGRKIVTGPSLTDPTVSAWSPDSGAAVYLHGGRFIRGLFRVTSDGPQEVLPAYPPVTALGSSKESILVARERRIDRMTPGPGRPKMEPALLLPPGPPITGVQDAGGAVAFATAGAVYLLSDNVVIPLAEGIGGTLHPARGGLLLQDAGSRRLFLLKSAFFRDL